MSNVSLNCENNDLSDDLDDSAIWPPLVTYCSIY